jgi:hypothetical protein
MTLSGRSARVSDLRGAGKRERIALAQVGLSRALRRYRFAETRLLRLQGADAAPARVEVAKERTRAMARDVAVARAAVEAARASSGGRR